MSVYDMIDEVNEIVEQRVKKMKEVRSDDLGLDYRSARRLYVDVNCIIVHKDYDRTLQYYGNFKCVDKSSRVEIGDYVIYLADDERVQQCLDRFEEKA